MSRSLCQCQGHRSKVYVYVRCLLCQCISLATLTYKVLNTGQSCYLNELIEFYQPVRQCRSSSQGLLNRRRSRTVLALRSFKHSSVAVWNSLPTNICNCSSLSLFRIDLELKIHLFCASVGTGPADPAAAAVGPIICDKQEFLCLHHINFHEREMNRDRYLWSLWFSVIYHLCHSRPRRCGLR